MSTRLGIASLLEKGISVLVAGVLCVLVTLIVAHHRLERAQQVTVITVPFDLEEHVPDPEEYSSVPEDEGTDYFMDALCYPDMGILPDSEYEWANEFLDANQECTDV